MPGHLASTTLDDIINELKLTYDSSVGLLDGDSVREVPSLNVLLNLNKLFQTLKSELNESEQTDAQILADIKARLDQPEPIEVDEDVKEVELIEEDAKPDEEDAQAVESGSEPEENHDESAPRGVKRGPESPANDNEDEIVTKKAKTDKEEDGDDEPLIKKEKTDKRDETERLNSPDDPVPPVQTGHFTHGQDTRLKNPKSEFVSSQTISSSAIAELGLFSEDNNGLETQGKEYLKRKYAVASYPDSDLLDLLPGKIPDVDFSKNKPPSNQVQFTTFQSYIESFYRLFLTDDLKFLSEKYVLPPGFEKEDYDPDVSPYIIPKLGRFYADSWAEEDVSLANKLNTPAFQQPSLDSYRAKGSIDNLSDDKLYTEDVSCGPLSSRLLSAILSIHEETNEDDEYENGSSTQDINADEEVATHISKGEDYELSSETNDFHSIEERLKRELKYIGIFMNLPNQEDDKTGKSRPRSGSIIDSDDWIKNKEDDEVSAEIRMLQKDLKEASARNRLNKKKLIPVTEEQIAYQEYCTILEDLDKQVDQAYMKRIKAKSKKKKSDRAEVNPAQQQALNTGLKSLLDKRKRWIENIGKLFKPPELMKRVPSESVLDGENLDDEAEEGEDVAQDMIEEKT